ncbi:hypothetical protein GW17_00018515 [Ensete ventricosum]|nr:hypothetical protein GW17_00018515 [Ensete ventricosum]
MESQREAVRRGKKGTVAVSDYVAAGGSVDQGGTTTVSSSEGCGKGLWRGCMVAIVAGEAECYSRGWRGLQQGTTVQLRGSKMAMIGEIAKEAGEGRVNDDNNKGYNRGGRLLAADGSAIDAVG